MVLSEMMPNRRKDHLDNFSICNIDRSHDWINESWLRYPEIKKVKSFIQQVIGNNDISQVGSNSIIDP